ncbi:Uncharacterised protein [Mycobacteroides abscessus subsp. abscessus]|nr:Uncharacterised protein [Mycobacteroides abscessus subsp. abscessus]
MLFLPNASRRRPTAMPGSSPRTAGKFSATPMRRRGSRARPTNGPVRSVSMSTARAGNAAPDASCTQRYSAGYGSWVVAPCSRLSSHPMRRVKNCTGQWDSSRLRYTGGLDTSWAAGMTLRIFSCS